MNRQEYRQLGRLSRAIAVVVGWWRELSRSVAGSVETCRAVAVSIRGGTQNPPIIDLTSSSLVPGISAPRLVLGRSARPKRQPAQKAEPTRIPTSGELPAEVVRRRLEQILAMEKIQRDRELRIINLALRSGTAAKVLG